MGALSQCLAKARFLRGRLVRAVWVRLEQENGTLSAPRLLLSTGPTAAPGPHRQSLARRWPVEPLFNQSRHTWGSKECWQQTRQGWARWVQIRCAAYTFQPLTAGRIRVGLQRLFA